MWLCKQSSYSWWEVLTDSYLIALIQTGFKAQYICIIVCLFLINIPDGTLIKGKLISIYFYIVLLEGFVQTVNQSGRPKIWKSVLVSYRPLKLFLKSGYHGTSMNLIAQEAGVTKLTVYNHFQDKANLFICAITETCEETLGTKPFELDASADFYQTLYMVCSRALQIIYSPKHLNSSMYYLNLQQSKVHCPTVLTHPIPVCKIS